MAAPIQVVSMVAGSTQPSLTLNVTASADGSEFDLTGYTVQLDVKRGDNDVLTKNGTLVDPTNGIATFEWLTTDLPTEGQFDAQLVLTSPGGDVWKVPGILIDVAASLR